ncbi:MAG: hypothetical protein MHM6MM_003164 [Cercozoa sp. M6MM]
MALTYLDAQIESFPEAASIFNELKQEWRNKLYHQLMEKVLDLSVHPFFAEKPRLLGLYTGFVRTFEGQVNELSLMRFCIACSEQCDDAASAQQFLEDVLSRSFVEASREATLVGKLEVAHLELAQGNRVACETILDNVRKTLDRVSGLAAQVHSGFYRVRLELDKVMGHAHDFYENALLLLSYTPIENIPKRDRLTLAADIANAALTSPKAFGFGELLAHGIMQSLQQSPAHEWRYRLLEAFSNGDLSRFQAILQERVQQKCAFVSANADMLNNKMRTSALIDLLFKRPKDERSLPFADIAQRCQVKLEAVELLLMKAMALGLLKGSIDEVEQVVHVTWVQPRVLGVSQMSDLLHHMSHWCQQVEQTTALLEGALQHSKEFPLGE